MGVLLPFGFGNSNPKNKNVFNTTYVSSHPGFFPPPLYDVYLYVMNSYGHVRDAVIAHAHKPRNVDEEVTYIVGNNGAENTSWPAKVITRAEYETWHEFDKS